MTSKMQPLTPWPMDPKAPGLNAQDLATWEQMKALQGKIVDLQTEVELLSARADQLAEENLILKTELQNYKTPC